MSNEKFKSLTPTEVKIPPIYEEVLDFVLKENSIKNIAITGIYGAGKSSLWKSYLNKQLNPDSSIKEEEVITVALSSYEKNNENKLTRVENQILNQIFYQIKKDDSSLEENNQDKIKGTIIIFLTALFLYLSFNKILEFRDKLIAIDLNFYLALLILFLLLVFISTYSLLSEFGLRKHFKIKPSKIKAGIIEANIEHCQTNNKLTPLDEEMRKLVTHLTDSTVRVIVFEDLDRFENLELFTKLRELNFLVNSNLKVNGTDKDKKNIKFVYMLKDGIFDCESRTKFFDFIIPVIPYLDSNNSRAKVLELFKSEIENGKLDKNNLKKISLYIDNMRLLRNIRNEYEIYSNALYPSMFELDYNKLFALLVIKNIFPQEFDLLQKDQGYIYSLFKKKDLIAEFLRKKYEKRLSVLKEKTTMDYDAMSDLINTPDFNEILNEQTQLEDKKEMLSSKRFKDLLKELSFEEKDNEFTTTADVNKIQSHPSFDFIKFLVLEGLIDETYYLYRSYFYEGDLTVNDSNFLKAFSSGGKKDKFYKLDSPNDVFNDLTADDFKKKELLNRDLYLNIIELYKKNPNNNKNKYSLKNIGHMVVNNHLAPELVRMFLQNSENINMKALIILCSFFPKHKEPFDIYNLISVLYNDERFKNTKNIIEKNMEKIFSEYIEAAMENFTRADYNAINYFKNKEKETLLILNSKIDLKLKEEFIDKNKTEIKYMNKITSKELIDKLISQKTIIFNTKNIEHYYKIASKDEFFSYLNKELNLFKKEIDYANELSSFNFQTPDNIIHEVFPSIKKNKLNYLADFLNKNKAVAKELLTLGNLNNDVYSLVHKYVDSTK